MAVGDNLQRLMPLPDDRMPGRCQTLAYPEAVLLVNPKHPELKGEVIHYYYMLLLLFFFLSKFSLSSFLKAFHLTYDFRNEMLIFLS